MALDQDRTLTIELSPKAIAARSSRWWEKGRATTPRAPTRGRIDLDVERLNTLPALLGEVDVLKVVQFLPGVQTNGEGNSGYVRGGGPRQLPSAGRGHRVQRHPPLRLLPACSTPTR